MIDIATMDTKELVARLGWHHEHPLTGKMVLINPYGPEAAAALTRIAAERDEARAEIARIRNVAGESRVVLLDQITKLEADLDEAVKVIEPFAAFAESLNEHVPDTVAIGIFANGGMRFGPSGGASLADLRAARSFLTKQKAQSHD